MLDVVLDVRWMDVGCTLDDVGCELQIMLDVVLDVCWMAVGGRHDSWQNVGKVVFCNCWAWSQNPWYGMCIFLLRLCINKCDVLAVKLACQGDPPLGAPAASCLSSILCCHILIGKHSQLFTACGSLLPQSAFEATVLSP